MKWQKIFLAVTATIFISSCGSSSNSLSGTGDPTAAPVLTAADMNTIAPCPNQSILTDSAALSLLKDALATGTLSFKDVPYDDNDADNFKKKCGYESFWDPANNIDEVAEGYIGAPPVTLSKLLTGGNAGICTANSSPTNFITGFPVAGTYRAEIKAAKGSSTWYLRLRGAASGSLAGKTFLNENIDVPADIENTLEYKVNGTVTAHDNLLVAIAGAASTSGSSVTLDVAKTAGGASVFNMAIELICVTKS